MTDDRGQQEIRNPNIEIRNKYENQVFKCSKRGLIDYLTGPAGLKTLPSGAVERLHACKLGGILTYFRAKIKKNLTTDEHGFTRIFLDRITGFF
jgi:hypothetical protein